MTIVSVCCFNTTSRHIYYLYTNTTSVATAQAHLGKIQLFQATNKTITGKSWECKSHKCFGITEADSGVWMCIAIQLCIEGQGVPPWSQKMGTTGRTYLASCLIEGRITPASNLIAISTGELTSVDEHHAHTQTQDIAPLLFFPRDEELEGIFPVYNMLHPGYNFIPCRDHAHMPRLDGEPDLGLRELPPGDRDFLKQWCQVTSPNTVLHSNLYQGEVTAADVWVWRK